MRAARLRNAPKPVHSQAAPVNTAAKTSTVHGAGRTKRQTSKAAPSIDAVRTRILSIGFGGDLRRRFAEAALALGEEFEGGVEMRRSKFGPQNIAEIHLRVRKIP